MGECINWISQLTELSEGFKIPEIKFLQVSSASGKLVPIFIFTYPPRWINETDLTLSSSCNSGPSSEEGKRYLRRTNSSSRLIRCDFRKRTLASKLVNNYRIVGAVVIILNPIVGSGMYCYDCRHPLTHASQYLVHIIIPSQVCKTPLIRLTIYSGFRAAIKFFPATSTSYMTSFFCAALLGREAFHQGANFG